MRTRRSKPSKKQPEKKKDIKLFIQLLVCIAIICGFMVFKDVPLSNGKTPGEYVSHFLNTTVNLEEIVEKFNSDTNEESSVSVVGDSVE